MLAELRPPARKIISAISIAGRSARVDDPAPAACILLVPAVHHHPAIGGLVKRPDVQAPARPALQNMFGGPCGRAAPPRLQSDHQSNRPVPTVSRANSVVATRLEGI